MASSVDMTACMESFEGDVSLPMEASGETCQTVDRQMVPMSLEVQQPSNLETAQTFHFVNIWMHCLPLVKHAKQ
eukprot:scaffold191470_cov19-Tisochrysis_lutea.AAC.1